MKKTKTTNKILKSVRDYYSNPMNYLLESYGGNSGGIDNDVTEKISTTKKLEIKYSLEIGFFGFYDSKIHYENGFSLDNPEFCQKFLQEEIERRKNHLEKTVEDFGRRMNNLDPSIRFSKKEMVPFEYDAELFVTFSMPSMLGQDKVFGMTQTEVMAYERKLKEREEKVERWREFAQKHGGVNNLKNPPLVKNLTPGRVVERIKIGSVKATGYSCEVTFERPGFKIKGMEFIGKVVPYVNSDDVAMQYAKVDLVDEYAEDMNLIEYLKKTSAQIKCDLCGRKSSRDIYFLFKDVNGDIHYYGRNCAEKAFGVDIIEKLNRFMSGLYKLGEDFADNFRGENVSVKKIKSTIMSMLFNDMIDKKVEYKTVNYYLSRITEALDVLNKNPEAVPKREDVSMQKIFNFVKENKDEADRLFGMYMAYGSEFYKEYRVSNEFSDKLKAFSLALLSGDQTAFRKLPDWVLPFSLNNFFRFFKMKTEDKQEPSEDVSDDKPKPYPQFSSYKTFDCEIVGRKEATTKYGKPYLSYRAYTTDGGVKYGIMWNDFTMNGQIWNIGDKVTVNGEYSKFNKYSTEFTNLDNVRTSPVEVSANQTENISNSEQYEIGTRLRDIPVVVKSVNQKYIVVETGDGINFIVYTVAPNRFGADEPKFGIDFKENMKLQITGTVQKSRSGYMFLNRCKLDVINESVRLSKSQLKRIITESVKMVLRERFF